MYPTEEELKSIAEWNYNNFDELMEYIRELWEFADQGYWKQDGSTYFLSTGGWSGNEDIIHALHENLMFWSLCWHESKRGGHYKFILPELQ
jgi:hypothetical protein